MFPLRALSLALLALACAFPAAVMAGSLPSGPGPRPGPEVLYAPAANAPQLENTGLWHAPPILISGASAYRDGEFLYQDFLYDDRGATDDAPYPSDPRYAGNAADLVELRVKPLADGLAVRLTFNSMIDPDVVGTTLALGDSPLALPMPHGALARMPAEVFITVHGRHADAVNALTGAVIAPELPVYADVPRRQVEVRIPPETFRPAGRRSVRMAAATGIWDPAAGAYASRNGSALFNVAFRGAEPANEWRSEDQGRAISRGDLSEFSATVDLAKLAAGTTDDSGVPRSGFMDRIMVSAAEPQQGRGDLTSHAPGCESACRLQYSGRLQPYALYVPAGPAPAGGFPLTLDLHGCKQTYNIGFGSARDRQLGDRNGGSIVLTPEARGDCYWYFGQAGADVFEAWADVARRYPLDPERTSIVGTSMGGYGAYKLAASYPDLFARVAAVAPCPGAGIDSPGAPAVPGGRSRTLAGLLPSLRHVPVMSWQTRGDTTCPFAGQESLMSRLAALGYPFSELTFDGVDHLGLANASLADASPVAQFLGDATVVRDPVRVTYVVNPAVSEPRHGLRADHAYWLARVVPANRRRAGTVDVSTGATAARRTPPTATRRAGALASGLPFVETTHGGAAEAGAPGTGLLFVSSKGVRSITVDAGRAGTGCSPDVQVLSPEPITVRLAGCAVSFVAERCAGGGASRRIRAVAASRVRATIRQRCVAR